MNAKQTIAILSLLAVIAAAFAAIPADAASGYEITAEYKETSTARIIVTLPEVVPADNFAKIYVTGDETDIEGNINFMVGQTKGRCTLESPLANGTYTVVVDTIFGVSSPATMTVGPVPVEHTISVLATPAEGGTITANKDAAFAGDEVTVTVTPNEEYKLTKVTLNGQPLAVVDDKAHFVMPDNDVMVVAMFEPAIVYCDVTFVIAEGFSNKVTATVGEPMQAPEDPEVIGAEFDGWYTEDGVKFDFETEIEGDMTLYAHFVPEQPKDAATKFSVLIGQIGANIGCLIYGIDGYVPDGKLTVNVKFATLIPGTDFYWNGSMDLEPITITSDGSDTVFGIATLTDFQYYSDIFAVEVSFDADGPAEPVKSSKIYFEPVLEA